MFIVLGILVFLIALVTVVLILPILIVVDSQQDLYEIRLWRIAKLSLKLISESPFFKLCFTLFGYSKEINLWSKKKSSAPKKIIRKKKKKKSQVKLFLPVLKTFTFNKFQLSIDTGDCITNAYLYPILYGWIRRSVDVSVNNNNENKLVLEISNRPIKVLYAIIKNFK